MHLYLNGRDEVVDHFGKNPEFGGDLVPGTAAPGLGVRHEKVEKHERLVSRKHKPRPLALLGFSLIEELFPGVAKIAFEDSQALSADSRDGEHFPPATTRKVVEGHDSVSLKFRKNIAPNGRPSTICTERCHRGSSHSPKAARPA